jgi:glycosyltransferase involved in cell wall biosynthesis
MANASIIIPMYNVSQFIEKCIESAYNQGMLDSDFEVIIVDDESPDNSLEIATRLTSERNNVTIVSQKNKGLGGARNTGLEQAKGDYIIFLDSDDFLLPNILKVVVSLAKEKDLDVLEFGAQGVNEIGALLYTRASSSNNKILNGIEYSQKVRYMDSACNKLYKRVFLKANNLTFLEKIFIEDYEFNTRVFACALRVMAVPTIVSHFFQNSNSITRNTNSEKIEKMRRDIIHVIRIIDKERMKDLPEKVGFYNQRLSFLTATLFYQLIKHKESYKSFLELRSQLRSESILFFDYPIYNRKKDFFRLVFLKNFWLLKLIIRKA